MRNTLSIRVDPTEQVALANMGEDGVVLNRMLDRWAREISVFGDKMQDSLRASAIVGIDGVTLDQSIKNITNIIAGKKYPESYPMVPVEFLGPFTDEFGNTVGQVGPYRYGCVINTLDMDADGYLHMGATSTVLPPNFVYTGNTKGAFLPFGGEWTLTTTVTEHIAVGFGGGGGIGVHEGIMADGRNWQWTVDGGGCIYLREWGAAMRIYAVDSASSFITLGAGIFPTRATPIYLRIAQTFPGGTRTLTYSYRVGDAGAFIQLVQRTPGAGYWAANLDCGVLGYGPNTATDFEIEFGELDVDYTPENTGDTYAFIPTAAFGIYKKNHVYVQKKNDIGYYDIDPEKIGKNKNAPFLTVVGLGALWRWDHANTEWVVFKQSPSLHGWSDPNFHTGTPGAVTGNIVEYDANGLGADSTFSFPLGWFDAAQLASAGVAGNLAIFGASGEGADSGVSLPLDWFNAAQIDSAGTPGNIPEFGASGEGVDSGFDFPIQLDVAAEVGSGGTEDRLAAFGASGQLKDGPTPAVMALAGTRNFGDNSFFYSHFGYS